LFSSLDLGVDHSANKSYIQLGSNRLIHGLSIGGGGSPLAALLDRASVRGGSDTAYNRTSSTFAAVDTTNLRVSFVAPDSGVVIVRLNAFCASAGATNMMWRLQTSGGTAVPNTQTLAIGPAISAMAAYSVEVTGLTAGTTYTWDWAFASSDNVTTVGIYKGPTYGQPCMEVWGVLE